MTRLIGWAVAVTVAEVAALVGVVHTLLHHAMLARGLPSWRLGDTLLTSPLLWTGATLFAASVNRLIALAALRAGRDGAAGGGVAAAAVVAVVGAVIAWFGLRAVGKLY
jgi:Mg/Co/Ni transporter MgtE